MNHSTPGLPVHHQLPEFTQTHANRVGDAIEPSHPLSSPSPPAPNPSQHQGLFQWVNSSHEVAKVLEFQLQRQSFQWTPRTDFLQDGLVGSPCSPRDSQESSPTPQFKASILPRSAFFTVQLLHPYMTTGDTIALTRRTFVGKVVSLLSNMLLVVDSILSVLEYFGGTAAVLERLLWKGTEGALQTRSSETEPSIQQPPKNSPVHHDVDPLQQSFLPWANTDSTVARDHETEDPVKTCSVQNPVQFFQLPSFEVHC